MGLGVGFGGLMGFLIAGSQFVELEWWNAQHACSDTKILEL